MVGGARGTVRSTKRFEMGRLVSEFLKWKTLKKGLNRTGVRINQKRQVNG